MTQINFTDPASFNFSKKDQSAIKSDVMKIKRETDELDFHREISDMLGNSTIESFAESKYSTIFNNKTFFY